MMRVSFWRRDMKPEGLTLENLMAFCLNAIQHHAGEVREIAEKIIVSLYRDVRGPVKALLPPDDEKTRKNVLYKQLFEAFDRIDGKPSKQDVKVTSYDRNVRHVRILKHNHYP